MKNLLPMKLYKMIMSVLTLIVLCCANTSAVVITNPSFEDGSNGWSHNDYNFYMAVSASTFHTDGSNGLRFASHSMVNYLLGNYESLYQTVDLTGITEVLFDVQLSSWVGSDPRTFERFKGVFLVDGTPYWTQTSGGTYLDQSADVSALSGNHTIELRIEALQSTGFLGVNHLTEWDNLRAIPEPATVALLGLGALNLIRRKRRA